MAAVEALIALMKVLNPDISRAMDSGYVTWDNRPSTHVHAIHLQIKAHIDVVTRTRVVAKYSCDCHVPEIGDRIPSGIPTHFGKGSRQEYVPPALLLPRMTHNRGY
jgi:hypothetical protein